MRWRVLCMLQFLAPYTISSFAKIPTLHERRNQNHAHGFSHTPSADTMPNTFSTSDSFFGRPSKVNTTDFELRLGSYKINPFKSGKLDGSQLYAAHVLQSESDTAFGGAFLSFRRRITGSHSQQSWKLGIPNGNQFIALHRFTLWWMRPSHCKNPSVIPTETQFLIGELPPDLNTGKRFYSVFIPLLDGPAKASLKGLEDGYLQVLAETGCNDVSIPSNVAALFVSVHDDVHELIFKSFRIVKSHMALQVKRPDIFGGKLLRKVENTIFQLTHKEIIRHEPEGFIPDFCKTLGWCTWDSFYTTVNEEKVINGLKDFKLAGLKPRWIILDDGWQSTTNEKAQNGEQWLSSLTSFKANSKFDLANTVKLAKDHFGIKHFFCWHAIAGYWYGLDLESEELRKYGPRYAFIKLPRGILEACLDLKVLTRICHFFAYRFGIVPPSNILSFYDDYHRYLKAQGVDGVKVDVQSALNCLGKGYGGTVALTHAYHKALSKSVAKHFPYEGSHGRSGRIIHCIPTIRGSDDFYPQDPATHGPHLYSNAFNSLMLERCGIQDWDMFQTNLGVTSQMHAAARAISGGPVYISDRPDKCNRDILLSLALDDGSVPIPVNNALPIARTMFSDPQSDPKALLTIWNRNPVRGHGILGIFNIYGSSWNPTKQKYMAIPGNTKSSQRRAIKGSLFPSDCYSLVKELVLEREKNQNIEGIGGLHAGTATVKTPNEVTGRYSQSQSNTCNTHKSGNDVFKDQLFAMYFFNARKLTVQRLNEAQTLAVLNFEVTSVSRVHSLHLPRRSKDEDKNNLQWASIGLVNLYNAGGAIVEESFTFTDEGGGNISQFIDIKLIGRGKFVAYCSERPICVHLDGVKVEWLWSYKTVPKLDEQFEGGKCNIFEIITDEKDINPSSSCDSDASSTIQQQQYQYQCKDGIIYHEVPVLEVNITQPYTGIPRR